MNRKSIFVLFFCAILALLPLTAVSAATAPNAPELTVTQLAGRFALSWSMPYNGGSALTGFQYKFHPSNEDGSEAKWITVDSLRTEDTTPALDLYGTEYTFRIKAKNEVGESAETVAHAILLHQNHINVNRVRDRVEQLSFSATLQEASGPEALKTFLEGQITDIDSSVHATVNVTSFEPAQLTQVGGFQFTVSLAMGNPGEPTYASTVTKSLSGVIASSGKLATPKIAITTSADGGLAYQITTTGTAAQAEAIQSFKISIFDTVNDQAVVTDYNVNAAEKSGVINLAAGLKGEGTYRAAVKACSADSLKYLDSDLSDLSSTARAGRIPITVRPSVTQKYYGDTEPIFTYEIVRGPSPLPTGVDLKLTFSRAEGTDVGTYSFAYQQTDSNYLVALEDVLFEILPRPLTIRPADREVIYEDGTTFLLQDLGTAEGLLAGDEITTLDFNPADSRGEVGEFEISASRAVILSGGKDVTKNYDITYAPGKLIIRPVGYTPEGEGGLELWVIFVIAAGALLLVAGIVLFFVLRRRPEEDYYEGAYVPAQGEESEEGEELYADTDHTEGYEEYLEIIDLDEVENRAEEDEEVDEEDLPPAEEVDPVRLYSDSETQATIEEIENAQAKTEQEDE